MSCPAQPRKSPTTYSLPSQRDSEISLEGLDVVRIIRSYPTVGADREQHTPAVAHTRDECAAGFLTEVADGDVIPNLERSWTGNVNYGALDDDVLVGRLLALDDERHLALLPNQARLSGRFPSIDQNVATRAVAVPNRDARWRPTVERFHREDADVLVCKEVLSI